MFLSYPDLYNGKPCIEELVYYE